MAVKLSWILVGPISRRDRAVVWSTASSVGLGAAGCVSLVSGIVGRAQATGETGLVETFRVAFGLFRRECDEVDLGDVRGGDRLYVAFGQ